MAARLSSPIGSRNKTIAEESGGSRVVTVHIKTPLREQERLAHGIGV